MKLVLVIVLGLVVQGACAATRSSTNYSITTESMDGGGASVSSANYTSSGSVGGITGVSTVSAPTETVKSGYVGQLYQVTGLELAPTFVNDGTTQQLNATQTLDDGTMLVLGGGSESWNVVAGQLPAGLTLDGATGVISGTPTGSGEYSFTVLVTDGLGDTAQQIFSSMGGALAATDTPTMPPWALVALALLLAAAGSRYLPGYGRDGVGQANRHASRSPSTMADGRDRGIAIWRML